MLLLAALATGRADATPPKAASAAITTILVVNDDPTCAVVLKSTRTAVAAGIAWNSVANGIGTGDPGLEALEMSDSNEYAANAPDAVSFVNPDIKRVSFVTVGAAKNIQSIGIERALRRRL